MRHAPRHRPHAPRWCCKVVAGTGASAVHRRGRGRLQPCARRWFRYRTWRGGCQDVVGRSCRRHITFCTPHHQILQPPMWQICRPARSATLEHRQANDVLNNRLSNYNAAGLMQCVYIYRTFRASENGLPLPWNQPATAPTAGQERRGHALLRPDPLPVGTSYFTSLRGLAQPRWACLRRV